MKTIKERFVVYTYLMILIKGLVVLLGYFLGRYAHLEPSLVSMLLLVGLATMDLLAVAIFYISKENIEKPVRLALRFLSLLLLWFAVVGFLPLMVAKVATVNVLTEHRLFLILAFSLSVVMLRFIGVNFIRKE